MDKKDHTIFLWANHLLYWKCLYNCLRRVTFFTR